MEGCLGGCDFAFAFAFAVDVAFLLLLLMLLFAVSFGLWLLGFGLLPAQQRVKKKPNSQIKSQIKSQNPTSKAKIKTKIKAKSQSQNPPTPPPYSADNNKTHHRRAHRASVGGRILWQAPDSPPRDRFGHRLRRPKRARSPHRSQPANRASHIQQGCRRAPTTPTRRLADSTGAAHSGRYLRGGGGA